MPPEDHSKAKPAEKPKHTGTGAPGEKTPATKPADPKGPPAGPREDAVIMEQDNTNPPPTP